MPRVNVPSHANGVREWDTNQKIDGKNGASQLLSKETEVAAPIRKRKTRGEEVGQNPNTHPRRSMSQTQQLTKRVHSLKLMKPLRKRMTSTHPDK